MSQRVAGSAGVAEAGFVKHSVFFVNPDETRGIKLVPQPRRAPPLVEIVHPPGKGGGGELVE